MNRKQRRAQKLDRWGRKLDLRGLFPDLTEDEALMIRAAHEGDQTFVAHMEPTGIARVLQSLTDKGYLDADELVGAEWIRRQSSAF